MAAIDVECPECAESISIEDGQLGSEIKCPKCKFLFTAAVAEGAYGFADEAPPGLADEPRPRTPRPGGPARRPSSAPKAKPKAETKAEREQRERMERWAERMDDA